MIGDAFDLFLTALVLAVGVRTINARETYAAVVAFVTYGLLVSLLWVRLVAIDVALAEAAIGGGLTGVLMLGAAARLRAHEAGAPAVSLRSGPDGVLAFLARLLAPLGVLIGLFLLWTGADNPGGTFQSGAVLAAMWLLAVIAGLADPPRVDSRRLRQALTGGPLFFIAVGVFGSLVAGAFLAYPAGWAKPFIVAIEIALALAVAATLAMLLCGPPCEPGSPPGSSR
jgi:uncharacterized MnhB-related membrane protein